MNGRCMPSGYRVPSDTRGPCSTAPGCGSRACESARTIARARCSACGREIGRDRPMLFVRESDAEIVGTLLSVRHEDCDVTAVVPKVG